MAINFLISALFVLSQFSADAQIIGGATSVNAFITKVVADYNKLAGTNIPPYASVGSGAGIAGFFSGAYKIAVSDDPLGPLDNAKADRTGGKYTLPLTITNFNFMTKKDNNINLTPSKIASIYRAGGITGWSSIKKTLSGKIVPVARDDSSGSTKVISEWLRLSGVSWITPSSASWKGNSFFRSNIQFKSGTGGVALYLAGNSNAIGYLQTGAGLVKKLKPTGILNPSGSYPKPSDTDPTQSLPRSFPPSDGDWNSVNALNKSGLRTYPIVAIVVMITRKKGIGALAKNFLLYTQKDAAQNLVNSNFDGTLFRLPTSLISKNNAAINKI